MKSNFCTLKLTFLLGILISLPFLFITFIATVPSADALVCSWQVCGSEWVDTSYESCEDVWIDTRHEECGMAWVTDPEYVCEDVWVIDPEYVCGYEWVDTTREVCVQRCGDVYDGWDLVWLCECNDPFDSCLHHYALDCGWEVVISYRWECEDVCVDVEDGYWDWQCHWESNLHQEEQCHWESNLHREWQCNWVSEGYWDEQCSLVPDGYWDTVCGTTQQTCPADYCSDSNECSRMNYYCGPAGCLSQSVLDNTCTNLCTPGEICSDGACILANSSPSQPGPPPSGSGSQSGTGGIPGVVSGVTWNDCLFKGKSTPTFYWTYDDPDGDPQTAYEIRIDDNAGFPSGTPDPGEFTASGGSSTSFTPIPTEWLEWMDWNTTYWWIVRVKDDNDNWSEWSDTLRFKAPEHAYPWSGFTWLPTDPTQEEVVIFDPEEEGIYYLWTVTLGEGVYADSTGPTNEEPHIKFLSLANKIKLKVTDSDAYFCESAERELTATLPLPEYKEIPPVTWIKNFLTAINGFFYRF